MTLHRGEEGVLKGGKKKRSRQRGAFASGAASPDSPCRRPAASGRGGETRNQEGRRGKKKIKTGAQHSEEEDEHTHTALEAEEVSDVVS